jgi:hypothetical protein
VAVHWPGTSQDRIGGDRAAIRSRLQHYYRFHTQDRGWRDIGYNIAIDQAGRVWMLRSTTWRGSLVGAHCASEANKDANEEYVGVLLLLGDREPPSAAMIYAFVDWYRRMFLPGWPNRTDVRMHGQVAGASTACAGPYVKAALPQLRGAPQPQEDDDMTVEELMGHRIKTGQGEFAVATLLANAALLPTIYRRATDDVNVDQAALAAALAPLAAALAPLIPAVDQDDLEAALRTVLGSVDDNPA